MSECKDGLSRTERERETISMQMKASFPTLCLLVCVSLSTNRLIVPELAITTDALLICDHYASVGVVNEFGSLFFFTLFLH